MEGSLESLTRRADLRKGHAGLGRGMGSVWDEAWAGFQVKSNESLPLRGRGWHAPPLRGPGPTDPVPAPAVL